MSIATSHSIKSPLLLLIIDDEEEVLKATKQYLTTIYPFQADIAISGVEALSMITQNTYDAIVADYEMEGMSGIDVLKTIRSQGNDTPFIIFTGKGREEVVIRSFDLGADGYVMKGGEIRSQFADLAHKIFDVVQKRWIEKELKDIEEQFQDIYYNSPIAIELYNEQGILTNINPACCALFGIQSVDEVKGFNLFDDPNIPKEHLLELKTGQTIRYKKEFDFDLVKEQNLYVTSRSGTLHLDVLITPMYKGEHHLSGYLVQVVDVTDQTRSQVQINEQKRFLDRLLETIPSPIYYKDTNGRYTGCNSAFEHHTGLLKKDIIGKTIFDIASFESAADLDANDKELFTHPGIQTFESQVKSADGRVHDILFQKVSLFDLNGEVQGLIGIMLDITERKQTEQALQKSENSLKNLVSNLPGFVYRCANDRDRTLLYVSDGCLKLTGYSPDDLMGNRIIALHDIIRPDYHKKISEKWQQCIQHDQVFESEYPIITREHETRWVWERARVVEANDTEITIEGFITDITDRKQMGNALEESNQKLRFLTGLTRHDILNLLNAIHVYHELALETADHDASLEYVSKAIEAGNRIEETIGFTREYEEFGIASSGWQHIYPIIESARREISPGNITIENLVPPTFELYADPIIRKVFSTLLENSVRHGKRVTHIRFSVFEERGDLIILYEDDGVGVPAAVKNRIFEHGFGEHTGIGLFLAREILSITGLSIRENGVEGTGIRFEITVPNEKWRE